MINQDYVFLKQCSKLAVLFALSVPMVAITAQKTLAIPIAPLLDQMGRRALEGLLGVGSSSQPSPVNQESINTQVPAGDPGAYSPPNSPPAYPPPANPPAYPTYAPASAYPPPAYPAPTYPAPAYPPTYPPPAYLPVYPAYPPARSSPPVIINNF